MSKILLVYPPFCTAASPPYSLGYLHSFLKNNLSTEHSVDVLDLNILFHQLKFPEDQKYFKQFSWQDYEQRAKKFLQLAGMCYSQNNKKVVRGDDPELLTELVAEIVKKSPDVVAFSLVYSSQAFYASALIPKLRALGIKTVIGGPAVNQKLAGIADIVLKNEVDLLEYMGQKKIDHHALKTERVLDFSIFNLDEYFIPEIVLPLRTSTSCYYQQCSFCTHHGGAKYVEHDLQDIKQTIISSKAKHIFFIDDMISKKRLLELAAVLKPLAVSWMCQLRPMKEFDLETLQILSDSGLKVVLWGVESGSDRILDLMKKGTNKRDIAGVLDSSHAVGIKNVLYIMFGFPTETADEFIETINFLKENNKFIDLISTSTFGLQKDSPMSSQLERFGIVHVRMKERTILEPKIEYSVSSGLTVEQLEKMKREYKMTLEKMNKFPSQMNYFREHMLCVLDNNSKSH